MNKKIFLFLLLIWPTLQLGMEAQDSSENSSDLKQNFKTLYIDKKKLKLHINNNLAYTSLIYIKNKIRLLKEINLIEGQDLNEVMLCHNNISLIQCDIFNPFTNLVEIDLSHNRIENLTNKIFINVIQLITLNLAHNKLATFNPKIIKGLNKLKDLNLSHNELKNFDCRSLKNKPDIIELDLCCNKLERLINTKSMPASIESLDLSHNKLNQLYNMHQNCDKISYFYFNNNNIKNLTHKTFSNNAQLEYLDASDNQLDNKSITSMVEFCREKNITGFFE